MMLTEFDEIVSAVGKFLEGRRQDLDLLSEIRKRVQALFENKEGLRQKYNFVVELGKVIDLGNDVREKILTKAREWLAGQKGQEITEIQIHTYRTAMHAMVEFESSDEGRLSDLDLLMRIAVDMNKGISVRSNAILEMGRLGKRMRDSEERKKIVGRLLNEITEKNDLITMSLIEAISNLQSK